VSYYELVSPQVHFLFIISLHSHTCKYTYHNTRHVCIMKYKWHIFMHAITIHYLLIQIVCLVETLTAYPFSSEYIMKIMNLVQKQCSSTNMTQPDEKGLIPHPCFWILTVNMIWTKNFHHLCRNSSDICRIV